jgi:hypothetical protein
MYVHLNAIAFKFEGELVMRKAIEQLAAFRQLFNLLFYRIAFGLALLFVMPIGHAADAGTNPGLPAQAVSVPSAVPAPEAVVAASDHSDKTPTTLPATPLPKGLTWAIIIGTTLVWGFLSKVVINTLRRQGFSLKDALMEEATLPAGTPPPAAGALPPMVSSSSRLIALFGTILLGTFFVAIGYVVIWQLCNGQSIQNATSAWAYFAGGATLFLPYGINKAASVLQ